MVDGLLTTAERQSRLALMVLGIEALDAGYRASSGAGRDARTSRGDGATSTAVPFRDRRRSPRSRLELFPLVL